MPRDLSGPSRATYTIDMLESSFRKGQGLESVGDGAPAVGRRNRTFLGPNRAHRRIARRAGEVAPPRGADGLLALPRT
jgi:hypothetical protein